MATPPLATAATSSQATVALLLTHPPPSPACLLIRSQPTHLSLFNPLLSTQDLSVAGYGMPSLSASGATIASPDSSLKPELRFFTFYVLLAETIVFSSWKHLQNFWLTASHKVAAEGEGGDFQTVQTLHPPLIFALILTCKWNQRILCDWTQSNQTRQPSSFTRRRNQTQFCASDY